MIFGVWCDRRYGFDYTESRSHGELAYLPVIKADGPIHWVANARYAGG